MENAAPVEIRKMRGFPPPLGKVVHKAARLSGHFPQALLAFLFLRGLKKRSCSKRPAAFVSEVRNTKYEKTPLR